VILSILEYGINDKYEKSLDYAENYMKEKNRMKSRCLFKQRKISER